MNEVTIGDCRLIQGDCRDVLPLITADALCTDPPYGVMLGEITNGQSIEKQQTPYTMFSDTPEYVRDVIVPAVAIALNQCKRGIITPGNRNAFMYPPPYDVGVWYNPAGTGRGRWGFILAHLIFYYGKDPKAGRNTTASSAWALNDSVGSIKNKLHPCPKPEKFTTWMIEKVSNIGETVLDPFMGSGTCGVACVSSGRKFIGIEIEQKYFDIACKRIEQAYAQGKLFNPEPAKPTQETLI